MHSCNEIYFAGLLPSSQYKIDVKAQNALGRSETSQTILVATSSFSVPPPEIVHDAADDTLTVTINATNYCVILMVSGKIMNNSPHCTKGVCMILYSQI